VLCWLLSRLVVSYLVFQNKGGNEYGPGTTSTASPIWPFLLRPAGCGRGGPGGWSGGESERGTALALGFGAFLTWPARCLLDVPLRTRWFTPGPLISVEKSGRSSAWSPRHGRAGCAGIGRNPLDFRAASFTREISVRAAAG